MCKKGNQTILAECRERALKELGVDRAPNKELRRVINKQHDHCFFLTKDKKETASKT